MKLALLALALPLHSSLLGGGAAPSSHLVYSSASFEGDILVNEVRVPEGGEAMYTYYEALGWSGRAGGYAGIQAHPRGHNYIFSIWDHKEHTAPIQAVYRGPGTKTENFGGEGTGLKSWNFELGWDTDVWYTQVARSWPVGDHTFYGYWVRSGKTQQWLHLVTMDVASEKANLLGGNDSFIEDWLDTGTEARTTHLRNGWKRRLDGEWHAFDSARYSVNSWDLTEGKRSFDFRTSWNGGVAKDSTGEYYFMTSGGEETRPTTENPSTFEIKREEKEPSFGALAVKSVEKVVGDNGEILVRWTIDPKGAPQFAYTISAVVGEGSEATTVLEQETIEPHGRTAIVKLPKGVAPESATLFLKCRDVFDRQSEIAEIK